MQEPNVHSMKHCLLACEAQMHIMASYPTFFPSEVIFILLFGVSCSDRQELFYLFTILVIIV